MHVLFKFPCKLNLTDINTSFNCLIISLKDNSSLSLSHHLPAIVPPIIIPSLSHRKATNAKSPMCARQSRSTTCLLLALLLHHHLFLSLFTRAYRSIMHLRIHTLMYVYVHLRRRNFCMLADSAVNVCKLATPISHAKRLPVAATMLMGHMENL